MKQYFGYHADRGRSRALQIVAPLVAQAQGGVPIVSALPAASYAWPTPVAAMTRTPTNFGPYEHEYQARLSGRAVPGQADAALAADRDPAVILRAVPVSDGRPDAEAVDGAQAVGGFMSAPPAPQASKKAP